MMESKEVVNVMEDVDDAVEVSGIGGKVLQENSVMLCAEWVNPKNPRARKSERLIVPLSNESYAALLIDEDGNVDDENTKVVGADKPYGLAELDQKKPVIIVGSEINALAIQSMGGRAIAIGRERNISRLIGAIREHKEVPYLIVSIEQTEKYEPIRRELVKKLSLACIDYEEWDVHDVYNDAVDALICDQATLFERVFAAEFRKPRDTPKSGYEVDDDYINNPPMQYFPTYYDDLDEALGGGLVTGLAVIGAVPSLGKTTFCLQMAVQMAQHGQDVIYYNLESTEQSMYMRILSRLTYIIDPERAIPYNIIARKLATGEEADLLEKARMMYRETIAPHLYMYGDNADVHQIEKAVMRHCNNNGKAPVLVVDYLQYLNAPVDLSNSATDKQIIDFNIKYLKRIAHDYKTAVVVVSSYNRDGYGSTANTSLCGSGAIEYTAEISIGLIYGDMPDSKAEMDNFMSNVARMDKAGMGIAVKCDIRKGRDCGIGELEFEFVRKHYVVNPESTGAQKKQAVPQTDVQNVPLFTNHDWDKTETY